MKNARVLVTIAVIVAFFGYLVATRQGVRKAAESAVPVKHDPLKAPLVAHMKEIEAIDFGTTTTSDVAVIEKGAAIQVVMSEKFLKKLGPGALDALGMTSREETMSWNRYNRFLGALHDQMLVVFPHAHDHHHENDNPRSDDAKDH